MSAKANLTDAAAVHVLDNVLAAMQNAELGAPHGLQYAQLMLAISEEATDRASTFLTVLEHDAARKEGE